MIFIFGGRYQGKTAYALAAYGETLKVCDLAEEKVEKMYEADIIKNVQEGVKQLLAQDLSPRAYFAKNIKRLNKKIIIGTEIGCGLVPLEEKERLWRDETGLAFQLLAAKAEKVERIWAGIPQTIKQESSAVDNGSKIQHNL